MASNRKTGQAAKTNIQVWNIVYPIFLYFAVCQIVNLLIGLLPFAASVDAVKRQGAGSLLGLIVLYLNFIKGKESSFGQKKPFTAPVDRQFAAGVFSAVIMLGCAGIALNNLIALTDLKQMSESYQAVEQAFYSSGFGWELLALGLITPIAEELLYRYIIFYQFRDWMGRTAAIVGSALIFGLIHMNIVQTIYAFALGLLLGLLMECYQDVRVAACGHIAANVLSLLRGETDVLSWLVPGEAAFVPVTVVLVIVTILFAILHLIKFKKD